MEHRTYAPVKVNFAQAKQLMDTEQAVLLDVREEEEYVTGHAEGALLLPVDTVNAESAARAVPDLDTPVLVYCRSGSRSILAAQRLCALGYHRVYNLGSLVGWPYGMEW